MCYLPPEVYSGEDVFQVTIADETISVQFGLAPQADVSFAADLKALLGIFGGQLTLPAAQAAGMIQLQRGSQKTLETLLNCFQAPNPT